MNPGDILTPAAGAGLPCHWLPPNPSPAPGLRCRRKKGSKSSLSPLPPAPVPIRSKTPVRKQLFAVRVDLWDRVSRVNQARIPQFLGTILSKTIVLSHEIIVLR